MCQQCNIFSGMIDQISTFDKKITVRICGAAFWGYYLISPRSITGIDFLYAMATYKEKGLFNSG